MRHKVYELRDRTMDIGRKVNMPDRSRLGSKTTDSLQDRDSKKKTQKNNAIGTKTDIKLRRNIHWYLKRPHITPVRQSETTHI